MVSKIFCFLYEATRVVGCTQVINVTKSFEDVAIEVGLECF